MRGVKFAFFLFPFRLREGLGEGMSSPIVCSQPLPRPLPQAEGER
jgi:hypothetical protein